MFRGALSQTQGNDFVEFWYSDCSKTARHILMKLSSYLQHDPKNIKTSKNRVVIELVVEL